MNPSPEESADDSPDNNTPVFSGLLQTLSLFVIVLFVLILTLLSGSLDPLILPAFEHFFGDVSDTAKKDVRMVCVLIAFSVSFMGMVLTTLEKQLNQLLIAGGVATVFFGYLVTLLKAFPDGEMDYKTLYIVLAFFTALLLPMALTIGTDRSRKLRHAYAVFSLSLFLSILVGLVLLGLGELLWPESAFFKQAGTMRYVITPMAVVIVTVSWGLMSAYQLIHDWPHSEPRNSWQGTYLVFAVVLSFLYGWIFLAPKNWVVEALLSEWQAGLVAQALLLPGILVFVVWLKFYRQPVSRLDWLGLALLCAAVQGLCTTLVATQLNAGKDDIFYPYDPKLDLLPFVAIHALASGSAILTIALVLKGMRSYPWRRLYPFSKLMQ